MGTKKNNNLFNPGGCLNADTFQRYLENSLSKTERTKVEEHLKECMICSEALEGYKSPINSVIAKNDLEFIKGKIRKRYVSKKVFLPGISIGTIAVLFLLIIILLITYYIIHSLLLSQ